MIAWIPPDTLFTQKDEDRWVWSLFDLAWQGRHPSLRAERRTWFRPAGPLKDVETNVIYLPFDLQRLRALRDSGPPAICAFPEEWSERLPGCFVSELPDLLQASADLIDVLLDMATRIEGELQAPRAAAPKAADAASGKTRTRRGRKPDTNAEEDKRIANAWATGRYKTFADLDRELNLAAGTAKRAVDRHRKRA